MGRGGGGFNDFGQNGSGSEVYLLLYLFILHYLFDIYD